MADRPARGVKRRRLTFAQHRLRFIQRQIHERPRLREWLMRLRWGGSDRDVVLFQRVFRINALRENGYFRGSKLAAANNLLRDETLVLQRVRMPLGAARSKQVRTRSSGWPSMREGSGARQ